MQKPAGIRTCREEDRAVAQTQKGIALVVGAGSGLSASLARALHNEGYQIALAARTVGKLEELCDELNANGYQCDASVHGDVAVLFKDIDDLPAELDVVVYNPSYRARGPLIELDPAEVEKTLAISAFGGFLVGQEAARRMLKRGAGAILFTGALRWASSRSAVLPRAWPGSSLRRASTSPISSSTAAFAATGARAIPIIPMRSSIRTRSRNRMWRF